ncbi:hypothetical protein BH24BAC1_BH24BAC1_00100 [soil metagenome]
MSIQNEYDRDKEQMRLDREQEKRDKNQEQFEEDERYHNEQTNHNVGDPTAKRNKGPKGIEDSSDDKGQLHNLVIEGNEASGYGEIDREDGGSSGHGGPGFKAEGGEYASPPIRQDDQVAD